MLTSRFAIAAWFALTTLGIEILGGSRTAFDAFRKSESKRMGDIVKQANLEIK